jgi:hypothetical protein
VEINYKTANGRFQVKFDGQSIKDLVEKVAEFQEIFEEDTCGSCKSDNVKFGCRTVDDNKYYEVVCKDCGCKLSFGQHKKGNGIFPKRKAEDGTYSKTNGWHKYVPGKTEGDVFDTPKSSAKGGKK